MEYNFAIMFMCLSNESLMLYFEGVTTWYQSVPGLNTLGTWEVVNTTMGLSHLLET